MGNSFSEENSLDKLSDEALIGLINSGNSDAQDYILNKYKAVVKTKARAYFLIGADRDDIIQEGMIGLFKAIRGYNPDRDASFRTFADLCINNQIVSAIKKANRLKHQPLNDSISFSKTIEGEEMETTLGDVIQGSSEHEPEELVLLQEIVKALKNSDSDLFSSLEWQVWSETLKGKSYQEIAQSLGRSPKSIDNALQRIKKKIIAYLQS